jgi:hypothetical protein
MIRADRRLDAVSSMIFFLAAIHPQIINKNNVTTTLRKEKKLSSIRVPFYVKAIQSAR